MADIRISALPTAPTAITGTELVPIVQNGLTVQTTVSAITQSPTQTQTFLTVIQQPTLPNSRYLSAINGIGISDGGAQGAYTIQLNGTSGSLESAATGIVAKTAANTITSRTLTASGNGISIANGNGVSGNPTFQLTGLALALANATGTGLLGINGSSISPLTITGASNQIGVTNGDGAGGNPVIGLANNPVIPGTAGVTLPIGSTAQRVNTTGSSRFNTDLSAFEGYNGTSWTTFLTSGVTTFSAGTTGFSPSSPTAGAVTLGGTLNAANGGTGASSLTGYLFGNGASPATASATIPTTNLSGQITNAQLVNSIVTINGNPISLGSSATVVANTTNPLTIGTGLSGTSFDGSAPVTVAINNTGVTAGTYGTTSSYPIITVNAQGQVTNVSTGAVPNTYQGTWNASTNSPTLTSSVGVAGYYYIVSVAGSTTLNGISSWAVGDWVAFNGSVWQKIAGTSTGTFANLTVTNAATLNLVTFNGSAGTTGQILTSAGAGVAPTWGAPAVQQSDVGYAANQIPLNQYLGRLAYQDALSAGDDGSNVFVGVSDVGNRANQVPLNQYLGSMAYQDDMAVNIIGGTVIAKMYPTQPTPTALTGSVTLTTAQIQTQIIQVTSATAVSLTMPTGTVIDGAIVPKIDLNTSIDFSIINTGSASGAVTVVVATGVTNIGSLSVPISTSAYFRLVRTALNTYIIYRLN